MPIQHRGELNHPRLISVPALESLEARRMLVVPVVIGMQFEFLTAPPRITFQFNTNVSASLSAGDVQIQNHTTLTRTPTASLAFLGYDAGTNTGTFAFPGAPGGQLPDGNYRARLFAPGVTDAMGNPMNVDGVLDFFVLAADANRDRNVNIGDFGALAANFNFSVNFAGGDFNYSGLTDISDFSLLASRFNQALPALAAPTTRYNVTLLPAPASAFGTFVTPYALNDNGQIVGTIHTNDFSDGDEIAFSWCPGDTEFRIGGGDRATGVSNAGLIVGWTDDNNTLALHWTHTTPTQPVLLRNLRGDEPGGNYKALGVNNANVTVGTDALPPGGIPFDPSAGVRWLNPTTIQQVGPEMLTAINDNGDMVGDGPKFYPNTGGPAVPIGSASGLAMGINQSREVVGVVGSFAQAPSREQSPYATNGRPFYWKHGAADPFMLEFAQQSNLQARAVNNAGQIVGSGSGFVVGDNALIWKDGMPYKLEDMLEPIPGTEIILFGAADINDNGQIVAFGDIDPDPIFSVGRRAFLLTPVASDDEEPAPVLTAESASDSEPPVARHAQPALGVFAGRLIDHRPDRVIEVVG